MKLFRFHRNRAAISLCLALLTILAPLSVLTVALPVTAEGTVSLSKPRLELAVGEADTIEVIGLPDGVALTWSSADPAIVAVNPDGSIKARTVGETDITAVNEAEGISLSCHVTVLEKAFSHDDNIIVTIFWPPSPNYTTDEQFELMAEAGINVVFGAGNGCDSPETQAKMIALAEKYGMRMIVSDGSFGDAVLSQSESTIMANVERYRNVPSVSGFHLRDEPMNPNVYFSAYKAIKKADPTMYAHINFLPYFVYSSVETYRKQLNDWAVLCNSVENGSTYLMFDLYPYGDGSRSMNRDGFYTNLEAVRQEGLANDTPTGLYLQSVCIPGAYRTPSASEIRYEVYAALAYGFKQLSYFTWFTPTGQGETFENGIISPEGVPNEHYEYVKEINHEVLAIGPTLVKCDAVDVYFVSRQSYASTAPLPDDYILTPASQGSVDILVSRLVHKETGRNYIMLVNNNFISEQSFSFTVAAGITGLEIMSRTDGTLSPFEATDGVYTVDLAAGDAVLLALPEDYICPLDMAAATESIEGVNLAPNAIMTASSSKGTGGWYVANLVDGNKDAQTGDSVGWQSYDDHYPILTFDLGEPIALSTIGLYPAGVPTDADYGAYMPVDTVISVSADGKTWTEAATVTGYAYDGSPLKIDLNGAAGRYVKLQVKKANADATNTPLTQLGEIEIYGTPAADKTALSAALDSYRSLSGDVAADLYLEAAAVVQDDNARQPYVDYLTRDLSYEIAQLEAAAEETTAVETNAVTEPIETVDETVPDDVTDESEATTADSAPDSAPDADDTDAATAPNGDTAGGCASALGLGAVVAVLACGVTAVSLRKKMKCD